MTATSHQWAVHVPFWMADDEAGAVIVWHQSLPPGWHHRGLGVDVAPIHDQLIDVQLGWRVVGYVACDDPQAEAEIGMLEDWFNE